MRPRILITGPNKGGGPAFFFMSLQVLICGGQPIRVTPASKWVNEEFDGLIVGGGADIHPSRYGKHPLEKEDVENQPPRLIEKALQYLFSALVTFLRVVLSYKPSRGLVDPDRDHMEFELLGRAIAENKPVLGICRGMQLINIFHGGSLHQDIAQFYSEYPHLYSVLPKRTVSIDEATQLFNITKAKTLRINTMHDHSIDDLGNSLKVTAREKNGIVQAIESDRPQTSIIGVQWHPEFLIYKKKHRSLFRWVISIAEGA